MLRLLFLLWKKGADQVECHKDISAVPIRACMSQKKNFHDFQQYYLYLFSIDLMIWSSSMETPVIKLMRI